MSERVLHQLTALCSQCGSPYRPTAWGREYLCPACGQPLAAEPPAPRVTLPSWLTPVVVSALLVGGVIRLALNNAHRAVSSAPPFPAANAPELPPHFRARLLRKVELLRDDLNRDPTHPSLLTELARSYISLAKLSEKSDPAATSNYLRLAKRCISGLLSSSPGDAARLSGAVREFRNLVWAAPGEIPGRNLIGPNSPGPLVPDSRPPNGPFTPLPGAPGTMPGGPVSAPGIGPALPPTGIPGGVPGAPGMRSPFAADPSAATSGPPPTPGMPPSQTPFAPLLNNAPAFSPLPPDGTPGSRSTDPAGGVEPTPRQQLQRGPREPGPALAAMRREMDANPGEVRYADQLGLRLTQEAYRARRTPVTGDAESRAYFRQALEVYLTATRRSKLRIHKAAFLFAASEMYGVLGDPRAERKALERAVKYTPFALPIWSRLQGAYLRNGMLSESRAARQELTEWTFPRLRPQQ